MNVGYDARINYVLLLFSLAVLLLAARDAAAQERILVLKKGGALRLHTDLPAAAYQWYKDGKIIEAAQQASVVVNEAGIFTVRAFNSESCPTEMSEPVEVRLAEDTIDLVITKLSDMKQVRIGDSFDYFLLIENKGPSVAREVLVTDTLPSGLEFMEPEQAGKSMTNYSYSGRTLSCNIAELGPNQKETITFRVKALNPGIIINTAEVTGEGFDVNTANNKSAVSKKVLRLIIPNIITPNGDGLNDQFAIPGLAAFPENQISIFNRWGNMVYQKEGYQNEWTGEGLADGTYFYVFKVRVTGGAWDQYSGYITLRRSDK